jgi:hypothetical protein
MPKYFIGVKEMSYGNFEVEAENKIQAEEKAEEYMCENGEFDVVESNWRVTEIKVVK